MLVFHKIVICKSYANERIDDVTHSLFYCMNYTMYNFFLQTSVHSPEVITMATPHVQGGTKLCLILNRENQDISYVIFQNTEEIMSG